MQLKLFAISISTKAFNFPTLMVHLLLKCFSAFVATKAIVKLMTLRSLFDKMNYPQKTCVITI